MPGSNLHSLPNECIPVLTANAAFCDIVPLRILRLVGKQWNHYCVLTHAHLHHHHCPTHTDYQSSPPSHSPLEVAVQMQSHVHKVLQAHPALTHVTADCLVTDNEVDALSRLSSQSHVRLSLCHLTESGLAALSRLRSLSSLHLTQCYGPSCKGRCPMSGSQAQVGCVQANQASTCIRTADLPASMHTAASIVPANPAAAGTTNTAVPISVATSSSGVQTCQALASIATNANPTSVLATAVGAQAHQASASVTIPANFPTAAGARVNQMSAFTTAPAIPTSVPISTSSVPADEAPAPITTDANNPTSVPVSSSGAHANEALALVTTARRTPIPSSVPTSAFGARDGMASSIVQPSGILSFGVGTQDGIDNSASSRGVLPGPLSRRLTSTLSRTAPGLNLGTFISLSQLFHLCRIGNLHTLDMTCIDRSLLTRGQSLASFFSELSSLPHLSSLITPVIDMSDAIVLSCLTNLQHLGLKCISCKESLTSQLDEVRQALPKLLLSLPKLESLFLSNCELVLRALDVQQDFTLPRVKALCLTGDGPMSAFPIDVAFPNVEHVILYGMMVTRGMVRCMRNLHNLQSLQLLQCIVMQVCWDMVERLTALRHLSIASLYGRMLGIAQIPIEAPHWLWHITRLDLHDCANYEVTELRSLTQLRHLGLSRADSLPRVRVNELKVLATSLVLLRCLDLSYGPHPEADELFATAADFAALEQLNVLWYARHKDPFQFKCNALEAKNVFVRCFDMRWVNGMNMNGWVFMVKPSETWPCRTIGKASYAS